MRVTCTNCNWTGNTQKTKAMVEGGREDGKGFEGLKCPECRQKTLKVG